MSQPKQSRSPRGKSKSKSKLASPRLYDLEGLPHFMQTYNTPGDHTYQRRRPKSEIVRELRRLSTLPTPVDEDEIAKLPAPSKPIESLELLDPLRLTRHRIEQLLQCDKFEETVRNCFVRLNVNEADNPTPDYRIAEIMSVERLSEGYYVDKTATNIALHLRFEDLLERHELNDISNMPFTQEEFDLWHDNCICQAIDFPTTELVTRKKLEIYNALNSGIKVSPLLAGAKAIPIRPPPRGCLPERIGGVYPWKLQPPARLLTPPPMPPLPALNPDPITQLETPNQSLEPEQTETETENPPI